MDLYPTLAELCGIPVPDELQGGTLVPLLLDPTAPGKQVVFTVVSRGDRLGKAVRTDRWRYAVWPDGEELYDLENDPLEHRNLANSEVHAATLAAMRTKLARANALAERAKR